eukprot:7073631-Pyramimonas_sp.AAC.1
MTEFGLHALLLLFTPAGNAVVHVLRGAVQHLLAGEGGRDGDPRRGGGVAVPRGVVFGEPGVEGGGALVRAAPGVVAPRVAQRGGVDPLLRSRGLPVRPLRCHVTDM